MASEPSSSGSLASPSSSSSSSSSTPNTTNTTTTTSSSNTLPNIDTPVLIAGAGPSGLMAGFLLSKLGIPSRIIERDHTPSPDSRAVSLHARTLEIFKLTDPQLYERFKTESWISPSMQFYYGSKLMAEIKPRKAKDSEFGVPWMLEQNMTVKILTEEYEKLGLGRVERGWELVDTRVVEQRQEQEQEQEHAANLMIKEEAKATTPSWVETTIRRAIEGTNRRKGESVILGTVDMADEDEDKQYEIKVVRSEYLIASDGGRSTVRHRLNIPFPGRTRDYNLILFDGHVETDLSATNVSFIKGDNRHSIAMYPIRDNRVRLMLDDGFLTQDQFEAREPKTVDREYFETLLQETLGTLKMKVLSYNWITYYRVNERRAKEFAYKRRIFLAGDAAHCHSPAGGQGLNTGLQDAYNLTWKIALILNGTASPPILDTYSDERIPIADEIIKYSATTLDNGVYQGWISSNLRKLMLILLPYIMRYLPMGGGRPTPYSMLGLRYHENSINKSHKSHPYPHTGRASIGQRAPDDIIVPFGPAPADTTIPRSESLAELEDETTNQKSKEVRLYDILAFPGVFNILVFAADHLATEKNLDAKLSKDIEHYQRAWSSRWPGLRGVLNSNSSSGSEAMMNKNKLTPQFMVHVISSATFSESDNHETAAAMGNRTAGYGKIYIDPEGGRLHEWFGFTGLSSTPPTKESASLVQGGGIVVLRPDTHIAFRVAGIGSPAWADVDEYFTSFMTAS
ncbi:MAG: FAD binding domain-containing protein [Linnemannia elongata]|nr:MAG: FAD binding domain-containing protein [Linnemannia elongata]